MVLLFSILHTELNFYIETDTNVYNESQPFEITLILNNNSADTIELVFPSTFPYQVLIDSISLGIHGSFVLVPAILYPNTSHTKTVSYSYFDQYVQLPEVYTITGSVTFYIDDSLYTIESDPWYITIETLINTEFELNIPDKIGVDNYPNPFNPITTIQYELPQRSDVQITIYDLLGREVATLVSETQDAGYKSVIWDATNDHGKPVSAGVYIYQIQAGEFVQTKKMVLLK